MPWSSRGARITFSVAPTSRMISISSRRRCRTRVVAVVTVRIAATRQHRADHEADALEQAAELREPVHPLAAALHFLHLRQRDETAHQRAGALRRRDGRVGRHLDGGGQRIARELLRDVGLAAQRALQRAQGLGLGDVAQPLDAAHRLDALQELVELGGAAGSSFR